MRLTKKVFTDLAIWMMGFGLLTGIAFPFAMAVLGIDRSIVYTWWFFLACIVAGLIVGLVNISLAATVVGKRLRILANHMVEIEGLLQEMSQQEEHFTCDELHCHIPVDSTDAIGESTVAFNSLVSTLGQAMSTQFAIRNYTRMLSSHLDSKSICENALQILLMVGNMSGGAIFVETEGALKVKASTALRDAESLVNQPQILDMLRLDRARLLDLPEGIALDHILADFRPRQVVLEPIRYKQVSLGVILLASTDQIASHFLETLKMFASGLALALNNAITHDQVQRLAALDPLTGVYNRRFGMMRLHEEFVRAVKTQSSLGVLMFDIDKFKEVNDSYGHAVGDRVIRTVAATARSVLREGDVFIRLGGDEFFAVLLGCSPVDVQQLGEKMRRQVEDKVVMHGESALKVSISVGGAAFPDSSCENDQELLDLADQALYAAKESGRNQVVMHNG